MSGKRILVDGYNVIRRTPRWHDLFRRDMAAARKVLIQHCSTLKTSRRDITEILVFFDGDSSVAAHPTPHVPGVRIVFTSTGVEADERIVEATRSGAPHGTVVVSDDTEVVGRCRDLGAGHMSVADFQHGATQGPHGARARPQQDNDKNGLTPAERREIDDEMRRTLGIE
ncbi:MAG: NYN domain-containing protein [Lentisphaerae bacterium]|nr:NYN domain-containing protein [Lentisphaerota bacterium]